MIRRNTWLLLVVLAGLIGFAFYLKNHEAQQAAAATPTPTGSSSQPLFSADLGAPRTIKIEDTTGNSVQLERNDSGVWVLKAPTSGATDQAAAEAAATQVTSLQVLSKVQLGLDIVGLDKPSYTISVTFPDDNKTHVLAVGALTPIQDGYYTSLDGGPIQIVDKPGLDALVLLLTKPPYAATQTPVPTATFVLETATDAPDLTGTPAGTPIPTTQPPADTPPAATAPTP